MQSQQPKTRIQIKYRKSSAQYFIEQLRRNISIEMMLILGGNFMMGAPETEQYSSNDERPQHPVKVATFFMSKYPITQEQWQAIMGNNPSSFKGNKRPVERVSWHDAQEFCSRLSEQTKRQYRLPTEAEWEYACRAGTTTPFYCGETITTDLANYRGTDDKEYDLSGSYGKGPKGKYREETTPVGTFPLNNFGLCDMHGNVWEWCEDDWNDNYQDAPKDGSAWTNPESSNKVVRGGSWNDIPNNCRSAARVFNNPDNAVFTLGFRVVCRVPRTS